MAINITKYVNITSGVGAGVVVAQVELIARLFTTNPLLPTNSYIDFTSAEQVGVYFGTASEEYLRAVFYFSQITKQLTSPQKISYARWADVAVAPRIYGTKITTSLTTFQGISDGAFSMTIGGVTNVISSLDFSTVLSFADVATVIQTAINAETGTQWTAATVSYDSVKGSFNFVGGDAVVAAISVADGGTGTEIKGFIGWTSLATFSAGSLAQSITEVLTDSTNSSNNFGSFTFIPSLSIDEHVEAAIWNDLQNNLFMYSVPVLEVDASDYYDALNGYSGTGVTISPLSNEYPQMGPMATLAATNYNGRNTVQNYMFQQYTGLTASVSDTATSDILDAIRMNYYGVTQEAGQNLAFYQRGVLMGGSTAAVDMNTYTNEAWMKTAITAQLMELLLSLNRLSANPEGISYVMSVLQNVVNQALTNGTIAVGKPLNNTQKAFITQLTGDPLAWLTVQNVGYWKDCVIETEVIGSITNYIASYTLIYSKDDVIRKVNGRDILI